MVARGPKGETASDSGDVVAPVRPPCNRGSSRIAIAIGAVRDRGRSRLLAADRGQPRQVAIYLAKRQVVA